MNYFKRLETIVIGVIILVLGVAFGLLNDKPQPSTNTNSNPVTTNSTNEEQGSTAGVAIQNKTFPDSISYPGVEGKTAMELLKASHVVETQNFGGVGEFVNSIDGVTPDTSHFWSFYINGQQSQIGADTYITKSSEIIEWVLEEIK
jgi:hypothetical protein